MTLRLSASLLAVGALSATLSAQQVALMDPGTQVFDVTPDGSIVCGTGPGGAFYWNWRSDPAPTYIGGRSGVAISDDALVIVGNMDDPLTGNQVAGRWTQATGWVALGGTMGTCGSISSGYDVSGDGTQVVGLGWENCSGRGFLWDTTNGMQQLDTLANGQNRASVISSDGSTIGGFAQGTSSRTPAFWDPTDLSGSLIDVNQNGEILGLNSDGSVAVGVAGQGSADGWNDAFVWTQATGMVNLGSASGGWAGNAADISDDSQRIVGYDTQGLARNAWIWENGVGITDANTYLSNLGLTGLPEITILSAMSDDGGVVVGQYDPDGLAFFGGFIADIDTGPWQNVGGSTAGFNGFPFLKGDGPLTAGSPATLTLTNTPPNAIMLAWLSFTSAPLNAFGGTIHANPFANQFFFFSDASGGWTATVPWPAGIPAGTEVWFQFLVEDVTSIYGIILSNGVKATTP